MGDDQIRAGLIEFLADEFGLDAATIGNDTPLFSSNMLSSLNLLNLVLFIEARFGISISPLEVGIENLDTIAKIVEFIKSKTTEK